MQGLTALTAVSATCLPSLREFNHFRESVGADEDDYVQRVQHQQLGYALLDMAKSACRVMKFLLNNVTAASPAVPVEGEWRVVGKKRRGKRRNYRA
jgi:hypothetical protein